MSLIHICFTGNAPLNYLKLASINWTEVSLYMINYLASITDSSVSGKIAVINNTTNRPNFNNKIDWLYHWGNVDDENNTLHITYYSTPIAAIEIKGSQYIYSTGEHTFYCKPNTANGNDVVSIRWSLDTNLYAKKMCIRDSRGRLTAHEFNQLINAVNNNSNDTFSFKKQVGNLSFDVIENEEAFEQIESKDENTVYFILEE